MLCDKSDAWKSSKEYLARIFWHTVKISRDCGLTADRKENEMLEKLNFRIVGAAPLIMHNGRLANPADKFARALKEISSKRKKVDADYEEMARLEWLGGLYLDNGEPCIPGYVLEGALIGKGGAARKQRMGKQAAAGLFVMNDFSLEYDGPRDPNELWKLESFRLQRLVVVKSSRVMRTRPIFKKWAANVEVEFNPDFVNADDVRLWMQIAGYECGLMDWRPKAGRFDVAEL
jgi:hypothetical protein